MFFVPKLCKPFYFSSFCLYLLICVIGGLMECWHGIWLRLNYFIYKKNRHVAKSYWYPNNNYLKGRNYPHTFNDPLGLHFTPPSHTLSSTTQFLSLKPHHIPPSMSSLVIYFYLLFESKHYLTQQQVLLEPIRWRPTQSPKGLAHEVSELQQIIHLQASRSHKLQGQDFLNN